MKKNIFLYVLFLSMKLIGQQQTVAYTVSPATVLENQPVTLTFDGNTINEALWGGSTGMSLYLWAWSFDLNDGNLINCPTNGIWTNSGSVTPPAQPNVLSYNPIPNTYTITFTPNTFFNRTGVGRMGFLIKALNGTGDKKSQDILYEVGAFSVNLTAPLQNSTTILASGSNLNITATNTNGPANYVLKSNGSTILNSANNVTTYSFNHTNITLNQNYSLEVTQATITLIKNFTVVVNPNTISQVIPVGLDNGVNYYTSDTSKVTLVLEAPGKDFVYVAGSFNSWQPSLSHAMKKDPTSGKFWLDISGLTSGVDNTFQYWVVDDTPIANSSKLVKAADPCSTVVLSPFDDSGISSVSYPNLPSYPVGQEREVTLFKTGTPAYNWQVSNFTKPQKDKLVIYEVLIRDFDANRNYQDLINRIQYFKELGINAIELMPVMEYEGNESWGYNTSFHMALDKYYGTEAKLKEFVDVCHLNGIAVILDIAFNHAYGRNPYVRMWMNDPDNDGWGPPATDNPFFNTVATHSYSVGEDFNHSSNFTRDYVKRTIKHWIQEFKIDGFRWDLTKGFTQNAIGSQANTDAYQQDRVDVLKSYVDYCWSLEPNHYAIFEHLGGNTEEQQWANYRVSGEADGISKGVMMWGEMFSQYKALAQGNTGAGNIANISHTNRGFTSKKLIGYPESHDKDRMMYEAFAFGVSGISGNLNASLDRMSAIGATSILIPGPKMIWHFQELGMDDSIWKCTDGTINSDYDGGTPPGDCKLSTKPQPQWVNNWSTAIPRSTIFSNYKKFMVLKKNEPVFNGDFSISPDGDNSRQRIYIFDTSLPNNSLKNVVILANFGTAAQNINPNFPFTGNWYNLLNNAVTNVTNTTNAINIPAGGFVVFGNQPAQSLSSNDFELNSRISLFPNPANNQFVLSTEAKTVTIYSITGQLVKSFQGGFQLNTVYSIDELKTGIYLVKVTDQNNRQSSTKLIKE